MPEQLTKHPEVTLQVLRSAGARCGEGAAPEILTQCPAARLCKLPGGEICVFGLPEVGQMTQVSAAELRALTAGPEAVPLATPPVAGTLVLWAVPVAFAIGAAAGVLFVARRRK
jgi:hypothetical protein